MTAVIFGRSLKVEEKTQKNGAFLANFGLSGRCPKIFFGLSRWWYSKVATLSCIFPKEKIQSTVMSHFAERNKFAAFWPFFGCWRKMLKLTRFFELLSWVGCFELSFCVFVKNWVLTWVLGVELSVELGIGCWSWVLGVLSWEFGIWVGCWVFESGVGFFFGSWELSWVLSWELSVELGVELEIQLGVECRI